MKTYKKCLETRIGLRKRHTRLGSNLRAKKIETIRVLYLYTAKDGKWVKDI